VGNPYPMKKGWLLTQESFDSLLHWLDADRDEAGLKYEKIRIRLIKIFTCRGCADADELADETINRVIAKLGQIVTTYSGDPALYFCGVANNIHLEYLRRRSTVADSTQLASYEYAPPQPQDAGEEDREYVCLEHCMERLSDENRRLVLEYYQEEKRNKINRRKQLADELGIGVNALRIRAHRIRSRLQECVIDCLHESPGH
jgi:RNA polymerase sigma factor (sigma-70 family)